MSDDKPSLWTWEGLANAATNSLRFVQEFAQQPSKPESWSDYELAWLWYYETCERYDVALCGPAGVPVHQFQRRMVTGHADVCRRVINNFSPERMRAARARALDLHDVLERRFPNDPERTAFLVDQVGGRYAEVADTLNTLRARAMQARRV